MLHLLNHVYFPLNAATFARKTCLWVEQHGLSAYIFPFFQSLFAHAKRNVINIDKK